MILIWQRKLAVAWAIVSVFAAAFGVIFAATGLGENPLTSAALGLTVQMFAGAGLGIAAQAFLAWGVIFHVMP